MLQQYHSELGEKRKFEATAWYNPFIKKWAVRTKKELKGRGVTFYEVAYDGRNSYHCTQKAFDKLCEQMDISQDILFD